jgi:hypothetical protein
MQQASSSAALLVFLVLAFAHTPAHALIDFENVPSIGVPSEGDPIGTQYEASEGVSFFLEGGGLPVIAKVGSPRTAFAGPPSNMGDDNPAPGTNVGSYFLTDDGVVGPIPPALIIAYSAPVSAASGVIVDIDGTEAWEIQARNASGAILETIRLSSGDAGTGDGRAKGWSFSRSAADIDSIRIVYVGQQSIVGLALDNFSPTTPASARVTATGFTALLLMATALAVIAVMARGARWPTSP